MTPHDSRDSDRDTGRQKARRRRVTHDSANDQDGTTVLWGDSDCRLPSGDTKRHVAGRIDTRSTSSGSGGRHREDRSRVASAERDFDLSRLIGEVTPNTVTTAGPVAPAPPRVRGLPVARLSTADTAGRTRYVLTAIDKIGRLADGTPARVMSWPPGTALAFIADLAVGHVVIRAGGSEHVNRQGRLCLPLHLRHRLALRPGDRLLLAIMPDLGLVLAYPTATLDAMIRTHRTAAAHDKEDS